jgi:hypothetical protein
MSHTQRLTLVATGFGLFMIFLDALIEGSRSGWGSPLILGLFAVAAIGGFLIVRTERRSADPMMDLTLFRNREYALVIGWRGFPRGGAALRDAEREEAKLAVREK